MKRLLLSVLVVLAAACADHAATQYAGVVMNEANPEAEGSLRLTIFTHTDTSFSGVIELGAPARGTGSAYAWFEGTELRIATVGQQRGDTILWISRLTDARLGGRFEVTGGDRRGQQGTWRAALVSGPPMTPATLRAGPPVPLPRATALWPLLVVIAIGVALARWIRRAPRAVAAAAPAADGGRRPSFQLPRESGIGGWLALFTIGQSFAVLASLLRLAKAWSQYGSGVRVGAVVSGMQPLIVLESAVAIVVAPVVAGGLVLLVRRSPHAPRYWFAYLAAISAYVLVDLLATPFIHSQIVQLVGEAGTANSNAAGTELRQLAVTLLWTLYWARSQRVRATFGAAALDRAAA